MPEAAATETSANWAVALRQRRKALVQRLGLDTKRLGLMHTEQARP
jgi:hypothetical protein